MSKKEMFKGLSFDEIQEHTKKYAKEVSEKWGNTDAYKESKSRTSKYTKEDWDSIQKESGEIYQVLVDNMDKSPSDPVVQVAIGKLRQHITDNFYNCTPEIFIGLGEMYVYDERFKAFYEKMAVGMAEFVREGIRVYCDNLDESL